ncbi:hypothetical protein BSM4216_0637 [Bacillus smithii]|nr:hypothetical protein BSM4216_0637 [Bacillus smithii]
MKAGDESGFSKLKTPPEPEWRFEYGLHGVIKLPLQMKHRGG